MQFIRTDANEIIASGHVMRCMTIAREIKKLGEKVVFLIADDYAAQMLSENGFEYEILGSSYRNMEGEIDHLKSVLARYKIKRPKILVDSYQVTPGYFYQLHKIATVFYIDDGMTDTYDVDGIIAYCHFYDRFGYRQRYPKAQLLLGCSYVPLREEFSNIPPKKISEKICRVMVTTGGADMYNLSILIAKRLCPEYSDIEFNFAVGKFFSEGQRSALIELSEKYKNIKLHFNAVMSGLMKECDVAVSAGGTTLYELCACKIPTICFSVADNQIPGNTTFVNMDVMLSCGRANELDSEEFVKTLTDNFEKIQPEEIRNKLSYNMSQFVDGRGAFRIAEILLKN